MASKLSALLDDIEGVSKPTPSSGSFKPLPEGFDLDTEVRKAADKAGVPYPLFRGLVQQESAGKHDATSSAKALGFTQLMPATAKDLGVDPYDPIQNLEGGARYLAQNLKMFNGDENKAVAAYNAGPGAVKKYGGIPPFKETQNYVPRVLKYANQYAQNDGPAGVPSPTATDARPSGGSNKSKLSMLLDDMGAPAIEEAPTENPAMIGANLGADTPTANPSSPTNQNDIAAMQGINQKDPSKPSVMQRIGSFFSGVHDTIPDPNAKIGMYYPPMNINPLAGEDLYQAAQTDTDYQKMRQTQDDWLKGKKEALQKAAPYENFAGNIAGGFIPTNPTNIIGNALLSPVIKAVAQPLKKGGAAVANILLKEKLGSKVGETVAKGAPSLTIKGIQNKAQKAINAGGELVKGAIAEAPDATVNMAKIAQDPDLLKTVMRWEDAGETGLAKRMLNKLAHFEKVATRSAEEGNAVKSNLWDLSKYSKVGRVGKSPMAEFNNELGHKVKAALAQVLPENYVKGLAQQSTNIPVANAAKRAAEDGGGYLRRIFLGHLTGGASELANHAATATPIASGLYQTGNILQKGANPISKILTALGMSKINS